HGGLAFTSSFCFESMIHYIKNKAFGTKNLGSQIMYWLELDAAISTKQFELQLPSLVNEIKVDCDLFAKYLQVFKEKLNDSQQYLTMIKLFLRFKDNFVTYHSFFIQQTIFMC
ncbi:unnamed protein product, partial [Rotaria socialis]